MTNLLNPAFAWVCRFMGHKWRRPHKAEVVAVDYRICKRCAAVREVKKRQRKGSTDGPRRFSAAD